MPGGLFEARTAEVENQNTYGSIFAMTSNVTQGQKVEFVSYGKPGVTFLKG